MRNKSTLLSKSILYSFILLGITSCNYFDNVINKSSDLKPEIRYNLDELNKREMGLINLTFSDQSQFKQSVVNLKRYSREKINQYFTGFDSVSDATYNNLNSPKISKHKKEFSKITDNFFTNSRPTLGCAPPPPTESESNSVGFTTQAIDFSSSAISKLALEVKSVDMTEPVSKTIKWKPGETASFSIPVLAGKNRIITLYALDDGNRVLGSLMGALDVIPGQNNTGKVSYFETAIAQTIAAIIADTHDLADGENNIIDKVDLDKVKSLIQNISGFNPETNTYTKIAPWLVNTSIIADDILSNKGEIPEESDFEVSELKATGSVNVKLDFTGARIILSDLNSKVVESSTELNTVINDVTLGEWDLTILKEGYLPQSFKVNVTDLGFEFNGDIEKDERSETIFYDTKFRVNFKENINDTELGIEVSDLSYVLGDNNAQGAAKEYSEGYVNVNGFGEHFIYLDQINYPVMSVEFDSIRIYDKDADQEIEFISDQELQEFGVYTDNEKFFIETNFDGTWTFDGKIVKTTKELSQLILNHPVFKDISIHSIGFLYELFAFDRNLPSESKTLVPINCGSGGTNKYNSVELMRQILKDAFLVMKERGN